MIEFRQKEFGAQKKLIFRPKNWLPELGKTIKNNPLAAINTVLSTSALGINMKRRDNEKKFQKEQIEATNNLTKAIEGKQDKEETRNVLKGKRKTLRKSQKPYIQDYYLPKPVNDLKENIKHKER